MRIDFYISSKERGRFVNSCEAVIRGVGSATKAATEAACKEIMEDSLSQVPRDTGTLASTAWYSVEPAFKQIRGTSMSSSYISANRYEGYLGYAGSERGKSIYRKTLSRNPGGGGEGGGGAPLRQPYVTFYRKMRGSHYPGGKDEAYRDTKLNGAGGRYPKKVGLRAGHGVANAINPKNGLPASAYAAVVHEDLDMPHPRGGKAKFLEDPVRNYAAAKFKRTITHYWKYAIDLWQLRSPSGTHLLDMVSPMYMETKFSNGGMNIWKGDSV